MNSPDFQIAFAKLISSPQLCAKVLVDEEPFFTTFNLTEKEKMRLHSVIRQKGISACCSLYRMNRVTPVYTQLSNTSQLLGDTLIPLIEEFWIYYSETSLQFKEEVLAFGAFLMSKIENGLPDIPYLKEISQLEIIINELSYLPEGNYRVIKFEHELFDILALLNNGSMDAQQIVRSDTVYKIYMQNQQLQIDIV